MKINERARAVQSRSGTFDRLSHMLLHMERNRAFIACLQKNPEANREATLEQFRQRFAAYRQNWKANPHRAISERLYGESLATAGLIPLCVDLELSAMCDLACPFCYRQHIATPDKLMEESLINSSIDQAATLGVPSLKFNWRGEPLLHPKLPQAVARAKDAGILDTIINTNAVTLTEKKSRQLINAGLDLLIYSFDGGTAGSYEKMRPGRFQKNKFENVYNNIKRFAAIRKEMGAEFPRTRIQMLLTEETFSEQASFFDLFSDCVDDVSVKAYTERGGSLDDLDPATRRQLMGFLEEHQLPPDTPYWRSMNGDLHVASGRLACEQPYQRLMVAYDGRVSMCCYDWGCEHPIGCADSRAYAAGDADYEATLAASAQKAKGFELLHDLRLPRPHIRLPEKVQTLAEIWHGEVLNRVREKHLAGQVYSIPICRHCPFKETYTWTTASLSP